MNLKKIKLNKKNILLGIFFVILSMYFVFNISWLPRFKTYTSFGYAIDMNNDRARVGSADNVFVAKVIRKKGTVKREPGVGTVYEVEIIKNIKGNLKGKITVVQAGGISGIFKHEVDGVKPLKNKMVYIFETDGFEHDISEHSKSLSLITDRKMSKNELLNFVNNHERVKEIEDAYEHEEYSDADLIDNTLTNSRIKFNDEKRIEELKKNRKRERRWKIENIKFMYKYQQGIILTDEEIDKIIALEYSDLKDIKIFSSPEESRKWYDEHRNDKKVDYKDYDRKKKKIEDDIKKRVEEEKKSGKYVDPRKNISKEEKEKEWRKMMMMVR